MVCEVASIGRAVCGAAACGTAAMKATPLGGMAEGLQKLLSSGNGDPNLLALLAKLLQGCTQPSTCQSPCQSNATRRLRLSPPAGGVFLVTARTHTSGCAMPLTPMFIDQELTPSLCADLLAFDVVLEATDAQQHLSACAAALQRVAGHASDALKHGEQTLDELKAGFLMRAGFEAATRIVESALPG